MEIGEHTLLNPKPIFRANYRGYEARIYNYKEGYYVEIVINGKSYREPEYAGTSLDHLECMLSILKYKILHKAGIEINAVRIYADFKLKR